MSIFPTHSMHTLTTRLFSWRRVLVYSAVFVGVFVAVQRALRLTCANWIAFDCPDYWPISIFTPRLPSVRDITVAAVIFATFLVISRFLEARQYKLWLTVASGVLLILGLTFIHGLAVGYYAPIAGDAQTGVLVPYALNGQEYYHDALTIDDPVDLLRRYNEIQPTLHRHAHTHPPGAVLLFYFLQKTLHDPALIAGVIMLFSMAGTAFFVHRIMASQFSEPAANYMTFLTLLLPAVQIYYLATIDAVITTLLIGALYLFCFGRGSRSVVGAAVLLCSSFFLTFVSLFILPVLVGFDLVIRRSVRRSAILIGIVTGFYLLLYLLTGYNAWISFRTASAFENASGFMLFTDPANYFFTRLEDVSEILFFLGPFLLVLFVRGMRSARLRPLDVLTILGCLTLLGMYVSGAWRTGETARACAFIYPFLLFPVARDLEDQGAGLRERKQLATLIFGQAVAMQLFGNYFW